MARANLGSTLVIANPASHSGKGAAGAEVVRRFFQTCASATTAFDLQLTEATGDAERLAAGATGRDTVVAVGGDGVIHEVVCGLMRTDAAQRPRLAVVPLGSGNDYARTLHLTANDPERALAELLGGGERLLDVGHVTSDLCPEGSYFTESLSFGLDAAIAIDTTRRRAQGTRQEGSGLFATSAIRLAARASKGYACTATVDDEEPLELTSLIFAVLNGPTYGGGFRICPSADPTDGQLDLCYNVRQPMMPHLMALLGLARFGRHTHSRMVRLRRMRMARVQFHDDVPCQIDGEELPGTSFGIEVVPGALRVLVSRDFSW